MSGATKASATPCASGTRASPQKKLSAMNTERMPRIRWTRIASRDGQRLPSAK